MGKIRIHFFILFGILLLSYCSNQSKVTQQAAFQEMMDLQEEVRPMIADVNQLYNQLEEVETSVDSANRVLLGEIDLAIRALEKAEQGMMAWINVNAGQSLADLQDQMSHKEIMQYLEEEKQNLEKVKKLMINSVDQSKKLINTIQD